MHNKKGTNWGVYNFSFSLVFMGEISTKVFDRWKLARVVTILHGGALIKLYTKVGMKHVKHVKHMIHDYFAACVHLDFILS